MSENEESVTFECIYTECKDAFQNEWNRKQSLENTANAYISVYAIILGFGLLKADDMFVLFIKSIEKSPILYFLIFISSFSLFYCIIRGLWETVRAIKLGDYTTVDPGEIQSLLGNRNKLVYLKALSKYFTKAVILNEKENNNKVEALQSSCKFIKATVIFVCVIILSIAILKILGGQV